jgi:hypothetical protein
MQGYEAVNHFGEYRQLGRSVIDRVAQLQQRIQADLLTLQESRTAALLELAVAYLPTLEAEPLARAEQLTGFRGFSRRDPLQAMAHESKVLQSTLEKIRADERYARRTYLVGPNGELTRELAERQSMLDTWQLDCDPFETLPGFEELLATGYDTPAFSASWWQPHYWKLWAQGDAICVALGLGDFGDDVLPAYEKVRKPRDEWRGQVEEVTARVNIVHNLVEQHDGIVARTPKLPEIYLAQCQQVLAEFLQHADVALLNDWLGDAGGDRAVLVALRRVAGLGAKIDILEDARDKGLQAQLTAFRERAEKHQRKQSKYQRPKNHYAQLSAADTDPSFPGKAKKLLADLDKFDTQLDRIHRYDDYGRFDLQQDPELWFVVFTQKQPSKFSPGLRNWYQRNPNAAPQYSRDTDDDGASIAAAVGQAAGLIDRTDSGYLS